MEKWHRGCFSVRIFLVGLPCHLSSYHMSYHLCLTCCRSYCLRLYYLELQLGTWILDRSPTSEAVRWREKKVVGLSVLQTASKPSRKLWLWASIQWTQIRFIIGLFFILFCLFISFFSPKISNSQTGVASLLLLKVKCEIMILILIKCV